MKKIIVMVLMVLPLWSFSQIEEMRDRMNDAMNQLEEGMMILRFCDAVDGEPIANVEVTIEDLGNFITDLQGRIQFKDPEKDARYAFVAKKEGYIPMTTTFEIAAGTIFFNRFSLSPEIDFGSLRVVLDWGRKPEDLDAHLVKENVFHISYRDKAISDDGRGMLDRDDQNGFGPETITLLDVDETANYEYFVKDYTNRLNHDSKNLSKADAVVRVYGNNQLLHEFRIHNKQKGIKWNVFRIQNGKIIPVNRMEY